MRREPTALDCGQFFLWDPTFSARRRFFRNQFRNFCQPPTMWGEPASRKNVATRPEEKTSRRYFQKPIFATFSAPTQDAKKRWAEFLKHSRTKKQARGCVRESPGQIIPRGF